MSDMKKGAMKFTDVKLVSIHCIEIDRYLLECPDLPYQMPVLIVVAFSRRDFARHYKSGELGALLTNHICTSPSRG